jgi:alginate O-acetyltransferase complex protein AlgI
MTFNSLPFFVFISAFLPLYFLTHGRARMAVCLFGSLLFYGWWDWRFLFLLATTAIVDYSLGRILASTEDEKKRKSIIIASVCMNLGFLGFFKYFNFFVDSFVSSFALAGVHLNPQVPKILLPVGISFYTFQSMSYTIDVYRKEIEAEKDFFKFATFVSLFPQLVAGPIVRARDFLPQFNKEYPFDWNRVLSGFGRILWGFFKKVAIADSIAPFVDQCFQMPSSFSSIHLLIGAIFYSFQIYCDFSGYSDIAIGLARIMGFKFIENFQTPYFSKNFSEFWKRWHISLSSWLRDYLYISLGGNRGGTYYTLRNNMITMLLGGLWHGANMTFIFWGFLHGLYLILQRLWGGTWDKIVAATKMPSLMNDAIRMFTVYTLTCYAWIYFRAPNIQVGNEVVMGILSFDNFTWASVVNKFWVMKGLILISILLTVEISNFKFNFNNLAIQNPLFRVVSYAILLWLISFFGTFDSNQFIYFQF